MPTGLSSPRSSSSLPARSAHVGVMLAATGAGAGVTAAVALAFGAGGLGGGGGTASLAVLVVLIAGVFGLVPALMHIGAESWGLAVLGGSMGRTLAALAIGLALDQGGGRQLDREGFWIGLAAGLVVVLVIEVAFAVRTLQKMDFSSASAGRAPSGGGAAHTNTQAHTS